MFISFCVLFSCLETFSRELQCSYKTWGDNLWPSTHHCELRSVDLSAARSSETFSFTNTPVQKSQANVIMFYPGISSIDFIPNEILKDFPNLNDLGFSSYNCPVIKKNLFNANFQVIEYLSLLSNKIHMIEANAFENLIKLKWIDLQANQIKTLPFKIFENNPELLHIDFAWNKIASIKPNFFDGLNKLKRVKFINNQCVDKTLDARLV